LTRIYEEHYRLLINVAEQAERGFLVTSVDSRSPTANMVKVGNPKVHGSLEPGDIITHVNGHAIRGLASLHDALDQAGGEVTLTVIDKSSSQEINWQTKTVKVQTPIIPGEDHPPTRDRVVRVLLIGLTDDERIGKGMQLNLTNLERILRSEIPGERLDIEIVSGADCNARTIISKVRELGRRAKAADSLFCYYAGHGAYDPRYEAGDPSGGHFFSIPSGDLLRKTLFDNMLAQPGRLKVLVTDTCNVRWVARIAGGLAYEQKTLTVRGPSPLEQLLLYHRGVLDLSATSRDQYGWTNERIGGWFTYTFGQLITGYADWQPFVDRVSIDANSFFLRMRQSMIDNPAGISEDTLRAIRDQTAMKPAVFRMSVTKDKNIPSGPARTIVRIIPYYVPE